MTISKKKGAGNVYGRSLKSKSLFWSFYKFSNLFANPNALCSRVSQFITNFRFFYVFINTQAHLHRKVLKKTIFSWSLQNSWAEIEKYLNFFARSCTKQFEIKSQFLHSFFEFLTTYETQKNDGFFSVLFLGTKKNTKNATFFCKERKRMGERFVLLHKNAECCILFSIYIYRYI